MSPGGGAAREEEEEEEEEEEGWCGKRECAIALRVKQLLLMTKE
jgi:hypothetical protein